MLQGDGKAFIRESSVRKESILSILPLYFRDSDETDVFDFGGTIKMLTLNGIYIDTTESAVKTFIDNVEALIQGHQDINAGAPYVFVDDRRGTIRVKILSFDSIFVEGFPTGATWSLKLVQSSTNA